MGLSPLHPVVIVVDSAGCHGALVENGVSRDGFGCLKTTPHNPPTNGTPLQPDRVPCGKGAQADGVGPRTQVVLGMEGVTEEPTTDYLRAHLSVLEQTQGVLLGLLSCPRLHEGVDIHLSYRVLNWIPSALLLLFSFGGEPGTIGWSMEYRWHVIRLQEALSSATLSPTPHPTIHS